MMYTNGRIPFICEQRRNLGFNIGGRGGGGGGGGGRRYARQKWCGQKRGSVKDTILVLRINN
jgi:hypothetical protein